MRGCCLNCNKKHDVLTDGPYSRSPINPIPYGLPESRRWTGERANLPHSYIQKLPIETSPFFIHNLKNY